MTETRTDVLLRQLSNPDQCLFVADCVDHVLPTFTAVYPQHEESEESVNGCGVR